MSTVCRWGGTCSFHLMRWSGGFLRRSILILQFCFRSLVRSAFRIFSPRTYRQGSALRKRRVSVPGLTLRKVADGRGDFLRQASHLLTAKAGVIGLEELSVKAMHQYRPLAKSVSDAGMAELVRQGSYKTLWWGRTFVQIDRWKRSTCNGRGALHDGDRATARVIRLHEKAFRNRPLSPGESLGRVGLRAAGLASSPYGC